MRHSCTLRPTVTPCDPHVVERIYHEKDDEGLRSRIRWRASVFCDVEMSWMTCAVLTGPCLNQALSDVCLRIAQYKSAAFSTVQYSTWPDMGSAALVGL